MFKTSIEYNKELQCLILEIATYLNSLILETSAVYYIHVYELSNGNVQ